MTVQVGSVLAPRSFGPLTMTDIVRYQGASGDLNPMHHDDELARSAGFPASFGVGMLNAGYLATFATDVFGTTTVRRFRTRFRSIVFRGDTVTATATVVRISDEGGERRVELSLALVNQHGTVVVDGSAEFVLE
jgi:acyl dehydratase